MMKDYYEKSMRALQLAGMSKRTQQCYIRSVRQIVEFYNKTPDLITEKYLCSVLPFQMIPSPGAG